MTQHLDPAVVAGLLVLGCGVAAWGGLAIGAPELVFRLRHLFVLREFELSAFGVVLGWIGGGLLIGIGCLLGGVFVGRSWGVSAGVGAVALALVTGAVSWRVSRERWGG